VSRGEAVASIHEGYTLHYDGGAASEDPDLALLDGDRLYAQGLVQLAELGDLDAVRTLADTISTCAGAHAERAPDRAAAAWRRTLAELKLEPNR
jgi:hypothetical protein